MREWLGHVWRDVVEDLWSTWRRVDAKVGISSWWRRRQRVDPWRPGHSVAERLQALNDEMKWVEDDEATAATLQAIEDRSKAELIVRIRIEA